VSKGKCFTECARVSETVLRTNTFLVHSHMLRHACGFKLANDGHDTRAIQAYLGHRSIMSTVRYTALTPNRFKNFWKD
jgi:site-specific recombinase XerD